MTWHDVCLIQGMVSAGHDRCSGISVMEQAGALDLTIGHEPIGRAKGTLVLVGTPSIRASGH